MAGKSKYAKYIFLLPALLWVLAFVLYPVVNSFSLSFVRYTLGRGREAFVGVQNYIDIFNSEEFWFTLRITIYYVLITVTLETLLGLFLAWVVNKRIKFQNFFRTVYTLPIFTTTVAVGYLGVTIFHETGGLANWVLGFFGLDVAWLSNAVGAFTSSVILDIWRWTPFAFIILLAGLQGVSKSRYEAAILDTKSSLKIFRYVELPSIRFSLLLVIMLRMVRAFKVFGLPFSLTGGGPGRSTVFYTLYVYRTSMKFFDFGHGAAMAYVLLIIVMIVIFQLFRLLRESFAME